MRIPVETLAKIMTALTIGLRLGIPSALFFWGLKNFWQDLD